MTVVGAAALLGATACGSGSTDNPPTSTTTTSSGNQGGSGGSAGSGGTAGAGGENTGGSGNGGNGGGASTQSPPAEVLQTGTKGLLLRGVVLTPSGVLDPGDVLVIDNLITCVKADCTGETGAGEATWIDTHGTISPGLIDSHNHLAYNFLPEWVPNPPKTFNNRYEWADDPQYEAHIEPYAAHRSSNSHYCPGAKWGELRSVVHGTTTMQGQPSAAGSCINWGVRNANRYHDLGYDHMHARIASVRDINDADAAKLIAEMDLQLEPTTRYHVHMAEGVSGNHIDEEFDSFAGRDPRENRHNGTTLLYKSTAVLIHSIPLTEKQLQETKDTNSKIVWSPSSNFALYGPGVTAPIERILQLGIVTGLGPDWTPSGTDEMLSEMRFALGYGQSANIAEITTKQLWKMATSDGAIVVGLQDYLGKLEVGYRADIAVFGRLGADPYGAVIDSKASDVRLVLIDGEGFFGDKNLHDVASRNDYCDSLDACGTDKFICVQDSPNADNRRDETLSDIHTQLYNILEGIGYPQDEQYGRGDELLELVDCKL